MDEKINNLQLQTEIENRNQQIRDLTEKLETLKSKRQDDKEKLKDYDKLKIQVIIIIFTSNLFIRSQYIMTYFFSLNN